MYKMFPFVKIQLFLFSFDYLLSYTSLISSPSQVSSIWRLIILLRRRRRWCSLLRHSSHSTHSWHTWHTTWHSTTSCHHLLLHLLDVLLDLLLEGLLHSSHHGLKLIRLTQVVLAEGYDNITVFNSSSGLVLVKSLHFSKLLNHTHLFSRNLTHLLSDDCTSHDLDLLHFDTFDVFESVFFLKGFISWSSQSQTLLKFSLLSSSLHLLTSLRIRLDSFLSLVEEFWCNTHLLQNIQGYTLLALGNFLKALGANHTELLLVTRSKGLASLVSNLRFDVARESNLAGYHYREDLEVLIEINSSVNSSISVDISCLLNDFLNNIGICLVEFK